MNATSNVTAERVRQARGKASALYVVRRDGCAIGLLEKYRDTRTERHPWKAFAGVGVSCEFLGAFYPEDGGRKAAMQAILSL